MLKQWLSFWFRKRAKQEAVVSLDLGKDDILVIHCDRVITSDLANHIQESFNNALEDNQKVWVLPFGMTYSIIKRIK
jgi:membrane-bound ClpP family serine protease